MNGHKYIGAEWLKVDLHLHSPGVESFSLPGGVNVKSDKDIEKVVKEYVQRLKEKEIRIGAITDYNGIRKEWFERIRNEAKEEGIIIFPGIELSLRVGKYGLHLLLIFEGKAKVDDINDFIKHINKDAKKPFQERKHDDIELEGTLEKAIEKIRNKYNCLVIFPHPNEGDSKGLLNSLSPKDAATCLKEVCPDGLEFLTDISVKKLKDAGLNDSYLSKIAVMENTDPKSISDIGNKSRDGKTRATYIKLSDFTLDALRLALHDPEVRVQLYKAPEFYFDRILKVTVNGTTFLRNIDIDFNPELNSLIGGRGTGKSSLIEAIRYCLDLPVYSESEIKKEFVFSVVGSGGEIDVEIERFYGKEKKNFLIKRIIGKEPEVFNSVGVKLGLSPSEIFEANKTPLLFGQKELHELSKSKTFQLKLIDELIGDKIRLKASEITKQIETLNANSKEIIELGEKLTKKEEHEQRLKSVESQIKIFEELGVVEKLRKHTDVLEDEEKFNKAVSYLSDVIEKFDKILKETESSLTKFDEYLRSGKSKAKNVLIKLAVIMKTTENIIGSSSIVEDLKEELEKAQNLSGEFEKIKKEVEIEIQDVKRQLGEQKLQPDKLEQLTKEKAKLIPLIQSLEKLEKDLDEFQKAREKKKQELKTKRHELFKIREEEIEKINNRLQNRLKLVVKFEEKKDEFGQKFKEILSGSKIHQDAIDNIVFSEGKAIDGILVSDYIKQGWEKIKKEFTLTDAMSQRICDWFGNEKRLFELETLCPEDLIEIKLNVEGNFKNIDDLSAGQKATALLLLLFAQENRILIMDQPEEDLDNRFVYEDVVKILRQLKGKNKLIVATHNANIPVLGDSELILVLEAEKEKCKIAERGSIDKETIRQNVKSIMEGGEEAFRKRAEKYGSVI